MRYSGMVGLFALCMVSIGCDGLPVLTDNETQNSQRHLVARNGDNQRNGVTQSSAGSSSIRRALELERAQRPMDALVLYQQIRAESHSSCEEAQARAGSARCLLKMNRQPAAMAVLLPLPDEPVCPADAERFALAGQIFLRMKDPKSAEPALRTACAHSSQTVWAAAAHANYAKSLLENEKPNAAVQVYRLAAELYQKQANEKRAEECSRFALDIERWLHNEQQEK